MKRYAEKPGEQIVTEDEYQLRMLAIVRRRMAHAMLRELGQEYVVRADDAEAKAKVKRAIIRVCERAVRHGIMEP